MSEAENRTNRFVCAAPLAKLSHSSCVVRTTERMPSLQHRDNELFNEPKSIVAGAPCAAHEAVGPTRRRGLYAAVHGKKLMSREVGEGIRSLLAP